MTLLGSKLTEDSKIPKTYAACIIFGNSNGVSIFFESLVVDIVRDKMLNIMTSKSLTIQNFQIFRKYFDISISPKMFTRDECRDISELEYRKNNHLMLNDIKVR